MDNIVDRAKKELECKRKEIESSEQLYGYISDVTDNYNYGYEISAEAAAQALVATADYIFKKMGMTGFQASWIALNFYAEIMHPNLKTMLRVINFDDMIYPQCGRRFDKVISSDTWKQIQNYAKSELDKLVECKDEYIHPAVKAHWESIVEGNVPFGYTVEDE